MVRSGMVSVGCDACVSPVYSVPAAVVGEMLFIPPFNCLGCASETNRS